MKSVWTWIFSGALWSPQIGTFHPSSRSSMHRSSNTSGSWQSCYCEDNVTRSDTGIEFLELDFGHQESSAIIHNVCNILLPCVSLIFSALYNDWSQIRDRWRLALTLIYKVPASTYHLICCFRFRFSCNESVVELPVWSLVRSANKFPPVHILPPLAVLLRTFHENEMLSQYGRMVPFLVLRSLHHGQYFSVSLDQLWRLLMYSLCIHAVFVLELILESDSYYIYRIISTSI